MTSSWGNSQAPLTPAGTVGTSDPAGDGGKSGRHAYVSLLESGVGYQPSVNGSRVAPDNSTHTALVSVKSFTASMPFSRPMPL